MDLAIFVILILDGTINLILNKKYGVMGNSVSLPLSLGKLIRIPFLYFCKKKDSKNRSLRLNVLIICILFEISGSLHGYFSYLLPPITYTICCQSKLIFTCVMSYFYLKKSIDWQQIIGIAILFVGIIIGCLDNHIDKNINKKDRGSEILPCISILIASFISSFASIYFEKNIKKDITDFVSYMLTISCISFCTSLFPTYAEFMFKETKKMFGSFKNPYMYGCTISSSVGAIFSTFLSTRMHPIKRIFYLQLIYSLSSIISQYFLGIEIRFFAIVSLVFVIIGACLYEIRNFWQLFKLDKKNSGDTNKNLKDEIVTDKNISSLEMIS